MRIHSRDAVPQAYVHRVSGRRTRDVEETSAPEGREDTLALSQPAQELQKVKKHLAGLPEVRQERVAELRARLARGDYHVPDDELADRILQSGVLDLPDGLLL